MPVHSSELAAGLINTRKPEWGPFQDQRFIPARRLGGDEEMAGTILLSGQPCGELLQWIESGGGWGVVGGAGDLSGLCSADELGIRWTRAIYVEEFSF